VTTAWLLLRLWPAPLKGIVSQTGLKAMDESNWKTEQLRRHDEARLAGRAERAARTEVHGVIPNQFFSAASSECRDVFIDGHYYGCIALAQAVAEGLSGYLGGLHQIGAKKDTKLRVQRLHKKGAISAGSLNAFLRIWGNDRNTFHHLNQDVPTDYSELERRAEECVKLLLEIESELFAFDINEGRIVPKHLIYWPKSDAEHTEVFLRLSGH
jgi:hypothetical protein